MLYADMIDTVIATAVKKFYPRGNTVWQDDTAKTKFPVKHFFLEK